MEPERSFELPNPTSAARFTLPGPTRLSRYEMGQQFAAAAGIAQPNLVAASRTSIDSVEPRAEDLSMDCSRFREAFPDFEFATIGSQIFE